MSKISGARLSRLNLYPFKWRGHAVGYFEDCPGNRYQVTTAWKNPAGEWHEFHLLARSIDEGAEQVRELVDYGRTVARMESELGRSLTIDELPKHTVPHDQNDAVLISSAAAAALATEGEAGAEREEGNGV